MPLKNDLEGLLVISVEQAVAAPYCSMLLAEAGARVIKVERPEGDFARGYDSGANGLSTIFGWLNRGKESLTLNFCVEEDLKLLKSLIAKADILLSNLAPGNLDKFGLNKDKIRSINPNLINCYISGYGKNSNWKSKKAYDFLVQGEVGLCSVTGTEESPARVGISIADISTGLTAFSSILRALIQRSKSKNGIDLELSMFDVLAEWMNMPLLKYRYCGGAPQRSALSHSFVAPYGAFKTKDDKTILLSVQNDREWSQFCKLILKDKKLINDHKFIRNVDRYENKMELDQLISRKFANLSANYLELKLDAAKIAYASLNSMKDLSTHHLINNKVIYFEGSKIDVVDLPLGNSENQVDKVPSLDQHGSLLRKEFGNVQELSNE